MSDYNEHLISQAGGDGDEVEAIQRRANKATAGPWGWDGHVRRGLVSARLATPILQCSALLHPGRADAEFIAHARTDVPYLLEVIRQQAAKLEKVRELTGSVVTIHGRLSLRDLIAAALEES